MAGRTKAAEPVSGVAKAQKIWMDGEFVNWDDAKIHVLSHVVHYGSSVFEGLRCYSTPTGPACFRLRDHLHRLMQSAKVYRMAVPYTVEELAEATKELIHRNGQKACYVRPCVFRGYGPMGVYPLNNPVQVAIATWEWGAYLGDEAANAGIDVCVSSWTRLAPNTEPSLAKAGANYMNSQLMKMEAVINGYAEAIALDINGYVAEGSGENIFVVKDGGLVTPPSGASILPGITRHSVIVLAKELGHEVRKQIVPREGLYIADEVFLTGSAAEVTPVRSVDRIPVGDGKPGPITLAIRRAFLDLVTGKAEDRYGWLERV
ncbi:MAG TPA: branched-chain amino acid transaminase [Planctomycetota bacterium]|nr:branched-chain amino acid transaminase [Planctomycetota bacterium]HRR79018.1 branched-chain amino acid transaminase [Planctomycetota bacterium]HRT93841.1 branched-chain amino acid transaminase [Planctomycetota bacterium]